MRLATHFNWRVDGSVAVISLARPERKNPLTFDSYAELRDLFRRWPRIDVIKAVVIASNGGNFSSGGDVHDIIGPLLTRDMKGLLAFTRMTGDLVKAMRACPQPVIAAVDGVCVGAGAMIAALRGPAVATPEAQKRVSLRARRPRRLRHGRLRDAVGFRCRGGGGGVRHLDGPAGPHSQMTKTLDQTMKDRGSQRSRRAQLSCKIGTSQISGD